jgi:uncharacterized protein Usg
MDMAHRSEHILPYRLTTVEITYHMPDYPGVLQNFIWQYLDIEPGFPVLQRFLQHWQRNIDGRLHSVKIAAASVVGAGELRYADGQFVLQ